MAHAREDTGRGARDAQVFFYFIMEGMVMLMSVGDITPGIPKYPCLYDLYMLYE
jgi:hypothetical protein